MGSTEELCVAVSWTLVTALWERSREKPDFFIQILSPTAEAGRISLKSMAVFLSAVNLTYMQRYLLSKLFLLRACSSFPLCLSQLYGI